MTHGVTGRNTSTHAPAVRGLAPNMDPMTNATAPAPALWTPPAAVRVRGALALVAGAGETARVYERFGSRIAVDGYVVAAFEAPAAADAAAWLAVQEHAPRVLVGSDRGAAAVLALAAHGAPVDGVIVAGTPAGPGDDAAADDAERTACPVHLGVLGEAAARATSAVVAAEIDLPAAAALGSVSVPVLAIHGGADTIAPLAAAREALAPIAQLDLVETVDGLHDALNDASHRSVAATIILWLERLRAAGVQTPIVREIVR